MPDSITIVRTAPSFGAGWAIEQPNTDGTTDMVLISKKNVRSLAIKLLQLMEEIDG